MNSQLEKTLAAMPPYPNLVLELARSGLAHSEVAKAIGKTSSTLKKKLAGISDFYLDEMFAIIDLLASTGRLSRRSFDYLFFNARTAKPADIEIEAARTFMEIAGKQPEGEQIDTAWARTPERFDVTSWSRGLVLAFTLLNWETSENPLIQAAMEKNRTKNAVAQGRAPRPETLKKVTDIYRAHGISAL